MLGQRGFYVTFETCINEVYLGGEGRAVSLNHSSLMINYSVIVTRLSFQTILYSYINSMIMIKLIHLDTVSFLS